MKQRWLIIPAVVTAFAVAVGAQAAPPNSNLNKGLKFEVAPYIWAAGIKGDATVQGRKVGVDVDFNDLVKDVDIAGSLLAVARLNRFVFWFQGDYFGLNSDDLNGAPSNASLDTDATILEAAAGYQFPGLFWNSTVDVMLGLRYTNLDNTLHIGGQRFESTQDLVDPMLVVRPNIPINNWITFNPTLAIGGGGDSDLIYELQPQFEFRLTDLLGVRVGYRHLYYKTGRDNNFDGSIHGFIAGVSFRF